MTSEYEFIMPYNAYTTAVCSLHHQIGTEPVIENVQTVAKFLMEMLL
jgi:hypothetical protein